MGWALILAGAFVIGSGILGVVGVWRELRREDPWPDVHQPSHVRREGEDWR